MTAQKGAIEQLKESIRDLPPNAPEAVVGTRFVPALLEALGFSSAEMCPEFDTGNGAVDHAARHNTDTDRFIETRQNPYLYVEVKGQNINLTEQHPHYTKTLLQLKRYLLGSKSESAQWGILTNSLHAQLFRKHGKVIYPVTACLDCSDIEKIDDVVKSFRQKLSNPTRALTVAVYNNKGGVGKTTTTINLAAALTVMGKRVLAVDFDPNQQDLGDALNMPPSNGGMFEALTDKNADIRDCIKTYTCEKPPISKGLSFDVILADVAMASDMDEVQLKQRTRYNALLKALKQVKASEYDYILIDAPPNWRFFSEQAMYAADVVLIPARHDNLHSLQNAAMAITDLLPQIQAERVKHGDAGPVALPVFLNGAPSSISHSQSEIMHKTIVKIVREASSQKSMNILPFFYPRWTKGHNNSHMAKIAHMAHIAQADFHHVPAVFGFKVAREQYIDFTKEYFLWD